MTTLYGSGTRPDDPSLPEAVRKRWRILDTRATERALSIHNSIGEPRVAEIQKRLRHLVTDQSEPPRLRLRKLYQVADEMMSHTAGFVACKRGCNHCCHIPLLITPMEADLIAADTGVRRRVPRTASAAEAAEPFEGYTKPCTFLVDGECSIYEQRPLACRVHYNVDDDDMLCRLDGPVPLPVPYLDVTPFRAAYLVITGIKLADIREFFPRGLQVNGDSK